MQNLLIIIGKPLTFALKSVVICVLFLTKLKIKLPRIKITFPKIKTPRKKPKNNKKKKKPIAKKVNNFASSTKLTVFLVVVIVIVNLAIIVYNWVSSLPKIEDLNNPPSQTTQILDRNGKLLYQIYRDENRTLVKLSSLPSHLIKATLATEDKNFFTHPGIDVLGITRAFLKNLKNCRFYTRPCVQEGGSTLTQQLVKNTLLGPEKTFDRKLKEAVLAMQVESKFSKEQILELYLNVVSYGGTAYGIEAASQYYFNKSASDLTLSEASLLAGITTSPTTLSPLGSHPYLAKERQAFVLSRMVEDGYITSDEKNNAIEQPMVLKPKNISIAAPHFVMWIKEKLVEELGEDLVGKGGLTVTTTLDLDYQKILEESINHELEKLNNLKVTNAAGLITNPNNGEILAMVGSHDYYDYEHDGQVNVTTSLRQPGSSIKPVTYALALMSGLNPTTLIDDAPICFINKGSEPYCPKNYDGRFHGSVTLRTALASSYNIPATKLLNSLGVDKMIELAKSMGITSWDDKSRFGLSLTLGGGEVKMVDMAEVYGTFANGGNHVPLYGILDITKNSGEKVSFPHKPTKNEVIPKSVAFQISNILSDNNSRAPAFGYNSVLNIKDQQVAVKTGTTNSLRDNWTFGYTKDYLVATWVGNNDNTPMSAVASGITGASPIWRSTMDKIIKDKPKNTFTPPSSMKKIALCKETKTIYCKELCPTPPIYDYFIEGTEPKGNCNQISGTILKEAASN